MALVSSSSSSSSEAKHHDVFLSFRGEDTRDNFISHLYAALCRKKIETFIDNDLHRGDEISPSLLKTIEKSKIAIIVFSKGYAYSRWCLEELAKIIECKNSGEIIVVPIFYHVDPSYVRNQTGTFEEAFVKHEEMFEDSLEMVQRWRAALTETANISGFESKVNRPEAALIEEIVKAILKRLNHMSPSYNRDLVEIESRMKEIELLLNLELNNIITVGIWGMGGIGKTTLAHAVFTKISSHFESVYFQNDVREELEKNGLTRLRQAFLYAILEDEHAILDSFFTKNRLCNKRILLVFDDVTCPEQIEKLIGDLKCFGPKSRIIITTRNKQVLKNCGVNPDNMYEVKGLANHAALKLFSQHAFKLNHPAIGYESLSERVVIFTMGVPLALKVLGSLLFGKKDVEWESALYNLERNLDPKIQDVLKISYDGLDDQQKNIFLDIACFFKGADGNFVMEILDVNRYASEIRVSTLIDKSLITIRDNVITMNDLLQKMCWKIVEQESKDPGKRSRLWHHDHIYRVLRTNTGTEAIEGIRLDMSKIKYVNLNRNAFLKMHNLRFFDFYWSSKMSKFFYRHQHEFSYYCKCSLLRYGGISCPYCLPYEENENKVQALQGLRFASTDLRFFRWFGYPLESLPSHFDPENLIALIMPRSKIKQLWKGLQHLDKLKHINLIHSTHLMRIPDLSLTPNLESLILEGCTSLIEISSSIPYLSKLVIMNLKGCKNLSSLPTSIHSEFLTDVILSGCSNLETAPKITCNMQRLYLDGTAIKELSMIEYPSRLVELRLKDCSRLESLPSTICMLKSLEFLCLSGCSQLDRLPNDLGNLEALIEFQANNTALREVPLSILHLNKLVDLSLSGCKGLVGSAFLTSLGRLSSLYSLDLSNCQITKLPDNLGQLSSLNYLYLGGNNFGHIPSSIKKLSKLYHLEVSYCESIQFLPKLPSSVRYIQAHNCRSLEEIDSSIFFQFLSQQLLRKEINLGNCCKLDRDMLIDNVENSLTKFQPKIHDVEKVILFPGNEVPDSFNFQNKAGSSVTFELQLDCMKKNFLGFAVCVVLTFQAHHKVGRGLYLSPKLIARDNNGNWEEQFTSYSEQFYMSNRVGRYCLMTDHVLVWYNIQFLGLVEWMEQEKGFGNFDSNGICATMEFNFGGDTESYEVKKCGVKLLSEQDGTGDSVEKSIRTFSSNEEEEREEPASMEDGFSKNTLSHTEKVQSGNLVCKQVLSLSEQRRLPRAGHFAIHFRKLIRKPINRFQKLSACLR